MVSPLVVGIDGSESSLQAAGWAAAEATRHGLPLRLLYASLWERYEGPVPADDVDRDGERALGEYIVRTAEERVRLQAPGAEVTTDVLPEDPVSALLRQDRHATAIVVGSRGRGEIAALVLGSVSLAVAASAYCPVVVVRGDEPGLAGAHGRVLLGIGEGDVDSPAVHFAFREAAVRGCELDVVRAWRRPAHEPTDHPLLTGVPAHHHEDQASALLSRALDAVGRDYPDVRVRRATIEGPARKVLLTRSAAADLLVLGARRRGSQLGMQLGRVVHTALHHASCPVAVVPHQVP
ncbi:universal stress protein [Streptomyces sp. NPDC018833]|uniref:universal stress protein n=1 Tax=Streptomyces sp. NPDC018833 TaxID=3365053 RepID=UPI00378B9A45